MARVKRRRSSGLRGTPAEHDRSVKFYTDGARGFFKDVQELVKKKDCLRAFPHFVGGVSMAGKASAHAEYAPSASDQAHMRQERDSAEKAFRKACIPAFKKAGIDGLSGARRRRRK